MKPIPVVQIGVGAWGKNLLRTIRNNPQLELRYCVSSNPETSSLIGPETRLLSRVEHLPIEEIAGVILACPPKEQKQLIRRFSTFPVSFFLEKPVGTSLFETKEIFENLTAAGRSYFINYIQTYNPYFILLMEAVQSGKYGRILSVLSEGGNMGPIRKDYTGIWDYGPHDLSMILTLLNGSLNVEKKSINIDPKDPSICSVELTGKVGNIPITCRFGNNFKNKVRLFQVKTEKADFVLNDCADKKLMKDGEPYLLLNPPTPLDKSLQEFVNLLQKNRASDKSDLTLSISAILDSI